MPGVPRARRNTRRGLLGRIIGHHLPQGALDRIGLSKGNGRETTFTRVWCLPGMDRVPALFPSASFNVPSLYLRAMRWQRRDSLRVSVLITEEVPTTGNHNVREPCGARVAHLEHRGSTPGAQGTRADRSPSPASLKHLSLSGATFSTMRGQRHSWPLNPSPPRQPLHAAPHAS